MEYKRTTHSVYSLQYHLVLCTKYRKNCINEEISDRLKKEFKRLIEGRDGELISIETAKDHVHMIVSFSPKYAIANEVATLKTVTSRLIRRDYSEYLQQFLWKGSFWSQSYFIASCGGVSIDVLKEYVETQNRRPGRPVTKHCNSNIL